MFDFLSVWRLLTGPVWRWVILAAVVALIVWGAFQRGQSVNEAKWQKMVAESAKKTAKVEAKQVVITRDVERVVVQKQTEIKWQTRLITERIPSAPNPDRPSLPVWFVSLHDAATDMSRAAEPAGEPDATPSGVTDDQALRVVVSNYGSCQADQMRLAAWQDWYRQISQAR